jgi:hypothetical protein
MHLALRCECGAWLKWVRKSQARRYQADRARLNAPMPAPTPIESKKAVTELKPLSVTELKPKPKVADTLSADLLARLERLERSFANYDSQLGILVRAILSCGVLQGKGVPEEIDVDSDGVDRLVRELEEAEGR